jgi:hypothetical protein
MPRTSDLRPGEFNAFYAGYVANVGDQGILTALNESAAQLTDYLMYVAEDRVDHTYAPGKWTIAQSLQHIIDTERIFSTRALHIARGDKTPLPGYEQNDYAEVADVSERRFWDMIEEFRTVRSGTITLFKSFTGADLLRMGTVSDGPASVRAIGFIISGHVYHHAKLYIEKYK